MNPAPSYLKMSVETILIWNNTKQKVRDERKEGAG